MTAPALLAAWAAIVAAPVIGRVGHHRTHQAGPAHPQGYAPAWARGRHGCDLAALHAAHVATLLHDRPIEAATCQAMPAKRTRRRVVKAKGNVLRMARRAA